MMAQFEVDAAVEDDDAEASADSIQLLAIATFSGLTQLVSALARRQLLGPDDLSAIHGAMALPLDDPLCHDDSLAATLRDSVDRTFADALRNCADD
jgi:hypothetical protein